MVFFGDGLNGVYQLRPWFAPLRALHERHRVLVVGTDSRVAAMVRKEGGLPALTVSHYSGIDLILSHSSIRLALYINHNNANFAVLSFPQVVHVSIMHGDSDKVVSISAQTKAYDFTFVAGQAAIDRLAANLPRFDAHSRCVIIGRPQATDLVSSTDSLAGEPAADPARLTVLYAPTWEGGTASAEYSSVDAYGEAIVQAILGDQRFRLIYRPHPLTGTRLPRFAEANDRLKRLVAEASRLEPIAGHLISGNADSAQDLQNADLLISDVSSLAVDFLATGRPLAITVPANRTAVVASTRLLSTAPRLGLNELPNLAEYLADLYYCDSWAAERADLARYYFGVSEPGQATAAFIDACSRMLALGATDRPGQAEGGRPEHGKADPK
jgi:hypothetical protein